MTFTVGDTIRLSAKHPHGPGYAKVIAIEDVLGKLRPRCEHIQPHTCFDGQCESEFFVMSDSQVDVRFGRRPSK